MCGRFVIAGNKAAIRDAFSVDESFQDELKPSWNVAPMQGIPFVPEQLREGELVRSLEMARWGLVPVWSKDPKAGARMINARSETVTEKPSFRTAAAKRRALIPAYLESVLSRCLSPLIEHLKSRPETYVGPCPRGG